MVCRSKHSDIQIESPRIWYIWHHNIRVDPMSGSEFWENGSWWSHYVSRGVGCVAMSLFVIGEYVGAREAAVAILERLLGARY